ncbi:MAG: serine hydrolase domain-containing protein [Pyrinomonadaceae bacterium]
MICPEISAFLQSRIDAADFPSAVYLVAEKGEIRFQDALGNAVVEPEPLPARIDTVFDLASLTKVLVTGLVAAKLIESGELSLDAELAGLLPDARASGGSAVTIRQLVTHTSGLPGWKPLYLLADHGSEITQVILSTDGAGPGGSVVYSDLGFILLGKIIERLTERTLDSLFSQEITQPLELASWGVVFNPLRDILLTTIAASENGNRHERLVCEELGFLNGMPSEQADRYFRDDVIWGEVHDGNAYFMGGVSGHAGLFGTAEDVLKIALHFLPGYTSLLRPETCELFTTNFTPGMNEHRSFAFQLASTPESTAGASMSPQSFGHLGFTGTSLWIDPVKERVFILLTNRTHNHPLPFVNINSVRRRFHDLAAAALDRN